MRLKIYTAPLIAIAILACARPLLAQQQVVDFESVGLAPGQTLLASAEVPDTVFRVDGVGFPSEFTPDFGGFWTGGWALTRSIDQSGSSNNLFGSAGGGDVQTATDGEPGTYAVGQQGTYILLPAGADLAGLTFTNTAYTASVVRDGSQFSRAFGIGSDGSTGVPDSLILSVSGFLNGALTFVENLVLADFRFEDDANDYVLDSWETNTIGESGAHVTSDSIVFRLLSSDNGSFGNNTPDFFAIAELELSFDPVSTRELALTRPLGAYPNPCRGSVTLDIGRAAEGDVFVCDIAGRVAFRAQSYRFGSSLEFPNLAGGAYWVLAKAEGTSYATSLLIE